MTHARLAIAAAVLALGSIALATGSLTQQASNALTAIDSVPSKPLLDLVFAGAPTAQQDLAAIASDGASDPGIRLRAIEALSQYCLQSTTPPRCDANDSAHQALLGVLGANANATSGTSLLALRAAIAALGPLQVAADADVIAPLLDHDSRDIRATAARALRDLCNPAAVAPLRARAQHEAVPQVTLAIDDALRVLGQTPSPCPP